MPTLVPIITSALMATLLVTASTCSGVLYIAVKEDGEYTYVLVNSVGAGSQATVCITAVDPVQR